MAEFDPDAYLNKQDKKKKSGFDPDAYLKKTEPESALQTFGRSSASLADTALNFVTGALDVPARAMARAYYGGVQGMPLAQAEERALAETTSPKDVVGRAFGVTGTQGYEQAPLRRIGTAVGETLSESVMQPIAQTTGLPESYVSDVAGMLPIPAIPKVGGAIKATGRAAAPVARGVADTAIGLGKVAMSPIETGKGVYSGVFNTAKPAGATVQPWETASARMPIGETYIPAPVLEQYRAGLITAEQAQAQALPTSTLPQEALRRTEGMVPYAGQEMRAAGEQIGSQYRDPYKLGAELGLDYLFGGLPTVARAGSKLYDVGTKARAYGQLGEAGFTPLTPDEALAFRGVSGAVKPSDIPQPIREAAAARVTPVQPLQLGYEPQRMYVSPEGVASTDMIAANRAGIEQKYPPVTVGPAVPETIAPTPAPAVATAPAAESVLGQKLTPDQILAQIQARSGKKGAGIFETAGEAPPPPIDLAANRASFLDKINQHRAGLEETRAQNRETFSGTAENLGRGTEAERLERMSPAERADYFMRQATKSEGMTDAAVVKDMVSTTTNSGVRRNKNTNIVDNSVFDELAADAGVLLDWSTAPDISKMGFKEGRKAMSDWMYKQIKTDANDLGLDARTGGMRGQIRQMEEANKNIQGINPAEEAAALNAAQERMKKLRSGSSMEMMSNPPATTFASKQDFLQQQMVDKLSGKSTFGSYIDDGKLYEYIQNPQATGVPADLAAKLGPQVRVVVTDLTKGTVSKDFKTSGDLIRERMSGPVSPDDILEMRTKTPETFQFGFDQTLPVTKRKSDWQKDQLFNQIGGETAPTAYRDGSNIVVDNPNPAHKLSVDGLEVANDFAINPRNKMAYDVSSGKRAPAKGAKFDPRVDNPFTIDDVANDKIPKDKPYKHKFFDGHPDAFEANIYDVEINPRGINTSKVVGSDRITEVYTAEGYKVFTGEDTLTKGNGLTRAVSEYGTLPHKAERGVTPDNRKVFQTESEHPITGQTMVQRYVGGVDIAKTNPEWFRYDLSDMIPEKDITYVYKPENPAMKTQTFTFEQLKNLPVDTYGDMLPIKDIKKITNKQISEIFTTKKKGK